MESSSTTSSSVKYDFYQTDSKIVIIVLQKNVTPEDVKVNFAAENVSATLKLPNNEDRSLNINLAHTVVPDKCSFKVRPSKIEISLMKEMGLKWDSLEREEEKKPVVTVDPKRWDAIMNAMIKDMDEDSSVNEVFNMLYSQGTDEQKRAMEKSYYESGGTVLSTDWKDVGRQKVEVKPPEGLEYKQW